MLKIGRHSENSLTPRLRDAFLRFSMRLVFEAHSARRFMPLMAIAIVVSAIVGGASEWSFAQDSFSESELNDTLIRNAVGNIYQLIEGSFGALVMVFSGIIALISAAMRNFKLMISVLIVALMCFVLRAWVSLFFGEDFENF